MNKLILLGILIILFSTSTLALDNPAEGITSYVYANGNLIASVKDQISGGGNVTFYNQDRLGSNRITTDKDGNILGEFKSYPYGQPFIKDNVDYPFTGKEQDDESEFYYFGARYYDSDTGRFIQVDPMSYSGGNLPYAYVGNNPIGFVDPSGTYRSVQYSLRSEFNEFHMNLEGLIRSKLQQYREQYGVVDAPRKFNEIFGLRNILRFQTSKNYEIIYSERDVWNPIHQKMEESFRGDLTNVMALTQPDEKYENIINSIFYVSRIPIAFWEYTYQRESIRQSDFISDKVNDDWIEFFGYGSFFTQEKHDAGIINRGEINYALYNFATSARHQAIIVDSPFSRYMVTRDLNRVLSAFWEHGNMAIPHSGRDAFAKRLLSKFGVSEPVYYERLDELEKLGSHDLPAKDEFLRYP